MAQLRGKLGVWELDELHKWSDRAYEYKAHPRTLITRDARVATIGSCFAEELANAMTRLGLAGAMHPGGLFYTPRSIRQELTWIFEGDARVDAEPLWRVAGGWVNPIRNYHQVFTSESSLREAREQQRLEARALFVDATVVVVTLGLIEAWWNAATGVHFNQIPHPDVFLKVAPALHRLTVAEIRDDLEAIRALLLRHTKAKLVVTVSPVPLHSTFTSLDVRVANAESKTRLRAATSEFIGANPDVTYFHSYEIVTCAERASDFMLEDGRHVSRQGVDYILATFLKTFAGPDVTRPLVDDSFLTAPTKVAEALVEPLPRRLKRLARRAVRKLDPLARKLLHPLSTPG